MQNRLNKYLEDNKIIYNHQFGFQKNKSTSLAVLDVYSKLIEAIENGKYSCSVFLDFAKAFDTINHEILLKKLEYYGIRGLANKWFKSYLSNRFQKVKISNTYSEEREIKCGVPQGSVLGPILFLIYINDIKKSSTILKFHLFADDTLREEIFAGRNFRGIYFRDLRTPVLTFSRNLFSQFAYHNCNSRNLFSRFTHNDCNSRNLFSRLSFRNKKN